MKKNFFLGVRIKFDLERSSNDFIIINENSDTEKYKIKLFAIDLFVPVAVIRNSIFAELNSILSKKDSANPEDNAMSYHFRRIELKTFTIVATTNVVYCL